MATLMVGLAMLTACDSGDSRESSTSGDAAAGDPGSETPESLVLEDFVQKLETSLIEFEMVAIPAGELEVEDEEAPGGKRSIPIEPFWIGKTEVSWDLFDVWLLRLDEPERTEPATGVDALSRPSKPYGAPDRGFGHEGYPALSMTYQSAKRFCMWLSELTGRKYRLPNLHEWSYACLAGQAAPTAEQLGDSAWYWENSDDSTHPLARKNPNAWGLHDMLGNAGEWVSVPRDKPLLAGGHFLDDLEDVHPFARAPQTPQWNMTDPQSPKSKWWLSDGSFVGFRLVCEP